MAAPGILTGGDGESLFRRIGASGQQALSNQGVFGRNPGSTAKYAFNDSSGGRGRDAEYRESMARLFVELPGNAMEAFLNSVSAETRPLARVLASGQDTGGGGGTGFIDFLLTRATEQMAEKAQIVDTLTDNYVAFYSGQEPPVFRYSGFLLNTYQDDQRVYMLRLYREVLRGTRLAARGLVARLRYDSFIVSGYMENLTMSLEGATEHTAGQFSFDFRVKRMSIFTPSLGAPTVAQTPATSNTLLAGTYEDADTTARVAEVTSEVPPTAVDRPASSIQPLDSAQAAQVRGLLLEANLTDDEVTALMAQAAAEAALIHEDGRNQEATSASEGLDRIPALSMPDTSATTFTEEESSLMSVNPENATVDAVGGMSNILGDTSQIQQSVSEEGLQSDYVTSHVSSTDATNQVIANARRITTPRPRGTRTP